MRTEEHVLELLETREDALLSWGVVDGGFAEEELVSLVDDWLLANDPGTEAWDLVGRMRSEGLLFRDFSSNPVRWRTRSAESLRLLARLRQLFPGQDWNENSWRAGPPLVADFRYLRRARSYPRRDQSIDAITTGMPNLSEAQRQVLALLTTSASRPMGISGFQVRAARQVLTSAGSGRSTGVVVGAGTGSGKTLAFYLPAFVHLVGLQDAGHWTRVVAVYPRTELLRDQLTTAFANARRVDEVFRIAYGRPLRVAAYYGPTPQSSRSLGGGQYNLWDRIGDGFRCPYLNCPGVSSAGCGGELIWHAQDVADGRERLVCAKCGAEFDEDVIALTREKMTQQPPDIVFTTTEMLNRSLSDLRAGAVFGVGARRSPVMMLLDEIHTYSGASGAQAAMVLRRWRNRLRNRVTFVGLSATLVDAGKYFSDLTGLPSDAVATVEPEPEELEHEGAEHLLALRSDPTTGVSVLSTTIQTSMLLARTLDPPARSPSGGLYGNRMFAFTDDLDVTNRLYYDLLDAEGQRLDSRGRPTGYKDALASLREPALGGGTTRRIAGQSWDLPEMIGHPLASGSRLRVGRTSSQDSGVDAGAQIIVATASLEVGFDDPNVGAVLQHKAPRDIAQFLQRRGRAGRPRGMRPWTAVVLSDYGRDRAAYEAWDALFDPVLPARSLPVGNRAVLRMHAVQSLLDWAVERQRSQLPQASMWRDLTRPRDDSTWGKTRGTVQDKVADLLDRLLDDIVLQSEVSRWIGQALQLTNAEVSELLWHPPRPVLLAAVPALIRRLRSGWAVALESRMALGQDHLGGTPLPDFFPSNLFSDLSLPEVLVNVPAQLSWEEEGESHAMGITQALREFAPGKVSRRFATRSMRHRHWLPLPEDPSGNVDVDVAFPEHEIEAEAEVIVDGQRKTLALIHPHAMAVQVVPEQIRDSSNAFPRWATQVVERGEGTITPIPREHVIGGLIDSARFHLHARHSQVEMRRLSAGSDATIQFADGTEQHRRTRFTRGDSLVGVGAVFDVDALRLDVALPADFTLSDETMRGVRSAWFHQVLTTDPELLQYANVFQLGWLHQALEVALIRIAVEAGTSLEEAFADVSQDLLKKIDTTMEVLFQRVGLVVDDVDVSAGPARLRDRLQGVLRQGGFMARLSYLAPQLWQPDDELLRPWLQGRLLASVGQAALAAGRLVCPEHDPDGVLVDIEPGVDETGFFRSGQVWLSERSIGGGGFIEALAVRLRHDPRRFLHLMHRALQPSVTDLVDREMKRILQVLADESPLSVAVAEYRNAGTHADRVRALGQIRDGLRSAGIAPEHSVVSAFANRLLRPGSTSESNRVVASVVAEWQKHEHRLGVEIDMRTWAFLSGGRNDLDLGLGLIGGDDLRQRRVDTLRSLLWPRGWQLRAASLQSWNPYALLPDPAPDVLRELLVDGTALVGVGEPQAEAQLRAALATDGSVRLRGDAGEDADVSAVLVALAEDPIELDFLHLHPRVVGVDRMTDGGLEVRLELAEVSR